MKHVGRIHLKDFRLYNNVCLHLSFSTEPPDNVSISFVGHALECIVQNVAPVKNLTVTFYRGQTALDQQFSSNANKKPMIASFTLDITTSKKVSGGQYWCEAKLDLGPEGPQPPPAMSSQNITVAMERESENKIIIHAQ